MKDGNELIFARKISELSKMELEYRITVLDGYVSVTILYTVLFCSLFGVLLLFLICFLSYCCWSRAVDRDNRKKRAKQQKNAVLESFFENVAYMTIT